MHLRTTLVVGLTALVAAVLPLAALAASPASTRSHAGKRSGDSASMKGSTVMKTKMAMRTTRLEKRLRAESADLRHERMEEQAASSFAFAAALVPSVPTDPTIDGVKPGGLPWVLSSGRVEMQPGGHLALELSGFVIPSTGGTGPVKTVTASVYCNGQAKPAAVTGPAPLSAAGHATIAGTVVLPPSCLAPQVLVNPNGIAGAYVAASGLAG